MLKNLRFSHVFEASDSAAVAKVMECWSFLRLGGQKLSSVGQKQSGPQAGGSDSGPPAPYQNRQNPYSRELFGEKCILEDAF